MNKILKSLFTIAIVAAVAVGATQALFSDTEESIGNTFTTGTIDIAVDGENPWVSSYEWKLADMKPSYTGYLDFEVVNVGTNPLNLWKTLKNFAYLQDGPGIVISEPECFAEGGDWVNKQCTGMNHQAILDIDSQINYDLRVELYEPAGNEPVWWETIYMDSDGFKMSTLMNNQMYLGMIPVGWRMKVIQSYHMVTGAGNAYQGDGMTFDIELYAEQLTNTVRLVNKHLADTDVSHHVWSDYADFSYKVMDSELNWKLTTSGVTDGDYTLLVWDDSDGVSGDTIPYNWHWNAERSEAVVLARLTDSGDMLHSGTYDPGSDINNAKIWLVPGHFGTVGGSAGNFPWDSTGTFFETGLIDFYDSLLP